MPLYLVIQISAFLSRFMPRSWRYLIGTAVGDGVYMVWGSKRRVLKENVATIVGARSSDRRVAQLARKAMRNYCKYLIEFLELPVMSPMDPVIRTLKINGEQHLLAALSRGKGMVLATAHYGTIEIPALRLQDYIPEFHAVYDKFTPAYLDRLIQSKRREKGIHPIPVNDVRAMMKSLKAGGALALLFDKPVEPSKGVTVRFFGRETAVPAGPALLALKTGATILPVYTFRHPDKSFESDVYPPIDCTPSGDRERDVRMIMQRLMDTLQQAVLKHPDQWYMFRPMWTEEARSVPTVRQTAAQDGRRA